MDEKKMLRMVKIFEKVATKSLKKLEKKEADGTLTEDEKKRLNMAREVQRQYEDLMAQIEKKNG